MFGRKILFLAAGYVAGNVVTSMYGKNKKAPKKVESKEDVRGLIDNFLSTQKNFISDIEKKYVSEGNREMIAEKKAEFQKFAEKYQKQGQEILVQLQNNKETGKKKAHSLFSGLLSGIRNILSIADEKLDTAEKKIAQADQKVKEIKKEKNS